MSNLHYSLYQTLFDDSDCSIVDLSKVESISVDDDCFSINVQGVIVVLDIEDKDSFINAWNRYKYAAAAAQFIRMPEAMNPVIACNSAMRLDEHLGFLAEQKLKEAMGGDAS